VAGGEKIRHSHKRQGRKRGGGWAKKEEQKFETKYLWRKRRGTATKKMPKEKVKKPLKNKGNCFTLEKENKVARGRKKPGKAAPGKKRGDKFDET